MLGEWGRLCVELRYIYLLFFSVCCSPCALSLSMEGEGLYEPKARNLTLLEQWDQRSLLAGGKTWIATEAFSTIAAFR